MKRIIAITLILLLTFSLFACKKDDGSPVDTTAAPSDGTSAPAAQSQNGSDVTDELVEYDENLKANLLGSDAEIEIRNNGGKAELIFPAINPESIDSNYLYTFRLTK